MTLGAKLFEAKYGAPIFPVQIQGPNLPGPDLRMAQFAAPGAQFAGAQFATAPKSEGPNLPPNRRGARFAGAQFA